jgi:hypothetical protein
MSGENGGNFSFPSDLQSDKAGDNRFGNNYVAFFVHKSGNSVGGAINTALNAIPNAMSDLTNAVTGDPTQQASNYADNKNKNVNEKAASAVKSSSAAVKDASANSTVQYPKSSLGDAITTILLMLPATIATNYETNYSTFSLTEAASSALGGMLSKGAGEVASKLKKAGPAASFASRMAINPLNEQLFTGVNNRTFSFTYEFLPKNEAETIQAYEIIRQFKYHMLPKLMPITHMYNFPNEFQIVYHIGKGTENDFINKISSCVLTGVNVEYTPRGTVTSFANGSPTEIKMSLSFKELAQLDKDMLWEQGL